MNEIQECIIEVVKFIVLFELCFGCGYEFDDVCYIMFDIYIKKIGGDFVVVFNEDGFFKFKILQYYKCEFQ